MQGDWLIKFYECFLLLVRVKLSTPNFGYTTYGPKVFAICWVVLLLQIFKLNCFHYYYCHN
jgi:hypothetical protein